MASLETQSGVIFCREVIPESRSVTEFNVDYITGSLINHLVYKLGGALPWQPTAESESICTLGKQSNKAS